MCLAPVIGPDGPAPKGITTQGKRWAKPCSTFGAKTARNSLNFAPFNPGLYFLGHFGPTAWKHPNSFGPS
jgi:hypothetical protein